MGPPAERRPCVFHLCLQAPPPAAPPRQLHGRAGGGHGRGFTAALLPSRARHGKNLQILNRGSCTARGVTLCRRHANPGQILPPGEHEQSKNPRQERPGLRRGAEGLPGSPRAGRNQPRWRPLLLGSELPNPFQDTFNGSASNKPFFTSVASIAVHVKDVDNRPPWFQPCSRTSLGTAKLCVSSGYRGRVNLTEKEVRLHAGGGRLSGS